MVVWRIHFLFSSFSSFLYYGSLFYLTGPLESLEINFKVSSALVEIVRRITSRPRYILAKVLLFGQMVEVVTPLPFFLLTSNEELRTSHVSYFLQ